MWQYVVLVVVPIILRPLRIVNGGAIEDGCKWKNSFSMSLFWFMLLALLILRRIDIGCDLVTYEYTFNLICINDWSWAIGRSPEIGWNLLNKLLSCFTTDFRWVIAVAAILSVIFLYRAFQKYSTDTSLSIALFVCTSCFVLLFSGLRQSVAMSLCLLAFEFAMEKKIIRFILCVVLAVTFHTSAFIIILLYPLCHIRVKKQWLVFIVPAMVIIFLFNQPIFSFLGSVLEAFTDYDATIQLTGSYMMLVFLIILAVISFVIPDESKLDDVTIAMRNILIFSVLLQMFAPLHSLAMRMNYYFIIFYPLLIPRIIHCRKENMKKIAFILRYAMLVFFVAYFFIVASEPNILNTFPYMFMWD